MSKGDPEPKPLTDSEINEMKEMKSFKDMIDAMTDEEIDHPLEKLNGTARERISRTTGKSTDDVTRLLFFFKQSLIVSTWLQERYVVMASFSCFSNNYAPAGWYGSF